MLIAWLAPLPLVWLAIAWQDRFGLGPAVAALVAFGWLGTFLVFNLFWVNWPCPRCGESFVSVWRLSQSRCAHCGLPLWASSDVGPA